MSFAVRSAGFAQQPEMHASRIEISSRTSGAGNESDRWYEPRQIMS
jgi:hypothetical protein